MATDPRPNVVHSLIRRRIDFVIRNAECRSLSIEQAHSVCRCEVNYFFVRRSTAGLEFTQVRRYLTFMTTKVSSKGQIVLPAELREQDRIQPGQHFSIERLEAGEYLLKKMPFPERPGFTDWLLACPEKGWFQRPDDQGLSRRRHSRQAG